MCTASSIGAPSRLRVTRLMPIPRSEEHTSELQSRSDLVCRLLLEKKKVRFSGMTEEESAPLLAFLFRHQVKPEFTCRFKWRAGSLAIGDNLCTQHNPVNDYHGHRRVMHRITLAGDRPR